MLTKFQKDRMEKAKVIIELMRKSGQQVCDSIEGCEDWQKYGPVLTEDGYAAEFNYCPYCGQERLKE